MSDTGDGPVSSETCGQFPAAEVRETFVDEYGAGDPNISSIAPSTAFAGSPAMELRAYGSNFDPDAVVEVDGAGLATTFVDAAQVIGDYTAPASVGSLTQQTVTVRNMSTSAESNNVPLTVFPAAADEEATE